MSTVDAIKTSLVLLLVTVVIAACAGVSVDADPGFALQPGDTFAWSEAPLPTPMGAGGPRIELCAGVERALLDAGLEPAPTEQADVLVDAWIDIDVVTAQVDPYFDLYVAERFERAIYHVELLRRGSGDMWRGRTRDHLRLLERAVGGAATTSWHSVDAEREWHVADAVEQIVGRLPIDD